MKVFTSILLIVACSLLQAGCKKGDNASTAGSNATGNTAGNNAMDSPVSAGAAVSPVGPSPHPGLLGEGDVLQIALLDYDLPGFGSTKPVRVMPDGSVSLYYIGDVKVGGMTEADATAAILKAYVTANISTPNSAVDIRRLQVGSGQGVKPIQPGDLVRLGVVGLQPYDDTVRISRVQIDGFIGLWYLDKVKIAGLTEPQAERAVAEAYRKANILQTPCVSVFVLEPAPPDASKRDLPDVPLQPVPTGMERLYVTDAPRPTPADRKK